MSLLLQTRYTRQGVEKEFRPRHNILRTFGLFFGIAGPVMLLIVLYTSVNPKARSCEWCEDLNCAPINALWFCDASGCSDDSTNVAGFQFPNGTLLVSCPSFVNKNVTAFVSGTAQSQDVINTCIKLCFPP